MYIDDIYVHVWKVHLDKNSGSQVSILGICFWLEASIHFHC